MSTVKETVVEELDYRYHELSFAIRPLSHNLLDRVKYFTRFKESFLEASSFPVDYRPRDIELTLLHIALIHNNDDVAHFLLDKGADVNITDYDGINALMFASHNPVVSLDLFKRLIKQTENINAVNSYNVTGYGYRENEETTVIGGLCWSYIHNFNGNDINDGWKENILSRIQLLLDAGADPDIEAGWKNIKGEREPKKMELEAFIAQYQESKKQLGTTNTLCYDYAL